MASAKSSKITTIKLDTQTKARLDKLKEHEHETYNNLINKVLNILNICVKNPSLASGILRDISRTKKRDKLIENPEKIMRKKQQLISNMQSQIQEKFLNAQQNMQRLRK